MVLRSFLFLFEKLGWYCSSLVLLCWFVRLFFHTGCIGWVEFNFWLFSILGPENVFYAAISTMERLPYYEAYYVYYKHIFFNFVS